MDERGSQDPEQGAPAPDPDPPMGYRSAVRTTVRSSAPAYGYTLAASTSLTSLTALDGEPSAARLFLFIAGAVVAFGVLELLVSGWRTARTVIQAEPAGVVSLGGALQFLSAGVALGVAVLLGKLIEAEIVWLVVGFAATAAYLALFAVQLLLARAVLRARR